MKNLLTLQFALAICFFSPLSYSDNEYDPRPTSAVSGQPNAQIPSKLFNESRVSPENLEKLKLKQQVPIVKENVTVKGMYQGVDFFRIRSLETAFLIDSGTTEEKPHFSSVKGFSFGGNFEFPIASSYLNGGTPIAKLRMGKTTIQVDEEVDAGSLGGNLDEFVDTLGASELYTLGIGGGYCYHIGYNCVYALYNSSFTGQLASNNEGDISAIPTKLKGLTFGVSSTFDVGLGIELSAGLEYSMMDHLIPNEEDHKINSLGLVFGLGFIENSRYKNSRNIKYIEPSAG